MSLVINCCVPEKTVILLTSCIIVSFSRKTQLHGVCVIFTSTVLELCHEIETTM